MSQPAPDPPTVPSTTSLIDLGSLVQPLTDALGAWFQSFAFNLPFILTNNATTVGQSLLDGLWTSPINMLTRIPPELTVAQPDVVGLSAQFATARVVLIALLTVFTGYQLMFGSASMTETAIKFGISIAGAAGLGWWGPQAVSLANSVSDGIGWPSTFRLPLTSMIDNLALGLLFLVMLFYAVKAFIKGAMTVLLLDVLLVVGPLVLLLWMLPQTAKWGAWWIDQFIAGVVSRPATAIVFRVGVGIIFTSDNAFIALILGTAAFALATELPDRLASNLSVSGGVASLAKLAVFQRAAGAAAGAVGGAAGGVGRALAGV